MRTKTLGKLAALWLLVVAASCVWGCGINENPGTGEKIGQIVRLNRTGILSSTWEGQLIRGGFTDGSGTVGAAPFHFTVPDNDGALVAQVQEALRNQQEVIITYEIEGIYGLTRSDGGVFLTGITRYEKNTGQ